jgi:hypothetical protein
MLMADRLGKSRHPADGAQDLIDNQEALTIFMSSKALEARALDAHSTHVVLMEDVLRECAPKASATGAFLEVCTSPI